MESYSTAGQFTPGLVGNANVGVTQQAAPTLVRAMAGLEELNKRLSNIGGQAYEIAQQVGGPYPIGAGEVQKDPGPRSAMQQLNDGIGAAHAVAGSIEQALAAVRRSLGA